MARRSPEDPKVAALRAQRSLNPHPERVRDEQYLSAEFFDARDAVQVKYEMVRRVRVDGSSISTAAEAFGYSRPSYYQAAQALDAGGLEGLAGDKPGPRGGHKLTAPILAWMVDRLAEDPERAAESLVGEIEETFGVRVHRRTISRALTRYRGQASKSR